jgi:hypothetical protein
MFIDNQSHAQMTIGHELPYKNNGLIAGEDKQERSAISP